MSSWSTYGRISNSGTVASTGRSISPSDSCFGAESDPSILRARSSAAVTTALGVKGRESTCLPGDSSRCRTSPAASTPGRWKSTTNSLPTRHRVRRAELLPRRRVSTPTTRREPRSSGRLRLTRELTQDVAQLLLFLAVSRPITLFEVLLCRFVVFERFCQKVRPQRGLCCARL